MRLTPAIVKNMSENTTAGKMINVNLQTLHVAVMIRGSNRCLNPRYDGWRKIACNLRLLTLTRGCGMFMGRGRDRA